MSKITIVKYSTLQSEKENYSKLHVLYIQYMYSTRAVFTKHTVYSTVNNVFIRDCTVIYCHSTVQYSNCTRRQSIMQYITVLYCTIEITVLYCTVQNTVLHSMYSTTQYVQYSICYNTVLYSIRQYCTIHIRHNTVL